MFGREFCNSEWVFAVLVVQTMIYLSSHERQITCSRATVTPQNPFKVDTRETSSMPGKQFRPTARIKKSKSRIYNCLSSFQRRDGLKVNCDFFARSRSPVFVVLNDLKMPRKKQYRSFHFQKTSRRHSLWRYLNDPTIMRLEGFLLNVKGRLIGYDRNSLNRIERAWSL
jgi:hypothetical protein